MGWGQFTAEDSRLAEEIDAGSTTRVTPNGSWETGQNRPFWKSSMWDS